MPNFKNIRKKTNLRSLLQVTLIDLKINDKNTFSECFDMLTNNSFYLKITLPIRLSNNHGTLIDNLLCKAK